LQCSSGNLRTTKVAEIYFLATFVDQMPKLLLEDSWKFTPDRSQITESTSKSGRLKTMTMPGVFSLCDSENGNKRRYTRKVWEANLKDGSILQNKIKNFEAWGVLEHPKDGVVDASSPISHYISALKLEADGKLTGSLTILEDLPDGHKLRVLTEAGWDPLVSTRGYGSVVTGGDGIDEVQEDYVCEGADVVSHPSFGREAKLTPQRESIQPALRTEFAAEEIRPPVKPQTPPSVQPSTKKTPIMEIKDIRVQLESIKGQDPMKLGATALAEGFSRMQDLHRAVSTLQAADQTAAWDCKRIHEEIETIEKLWDSKLDETKKSAVKLAEDKKKLIVVNEAAVKLAKLYRATLEDQVKKSNGRQKLYEEICKRGRGWKDIAERRGLVQENTEFKLAISTTANDMIADKYKLLNEKFEVTTSALDLLTERYHEDTTKLGKALLELQYPEKIKAPAIQEKLNEATTAAQVLQIRLEIEDPEAAKKAASKVESTPAKAAGKLVENKNVAKDPPNSSPSSKGIIVENTDWDGNRLNLDETLAVTRRLCQTTPAKAITKAA
jgi:hypothetical protein